MALGSNPNPKPKPQPKPNPNPNLGTSSRSGSLARSRPRTRSTRGKPSCNKGYKMTPENAVITPLFSSYRVQLNNNYLHTRLPDLPVWCPALFSPCYVRVFHPLATVAPRRAEPPAKSASSDDGQRRFQATARYAWRQRPALSLIASMPACRLHSTPTKHILCRRRLHASPQKGQAWCPKAFRPRR